MGTHSVRQGLCCCSQRIPTRSCVLLLCPLLLLLLLVACSWFEHQARRQPSVRAAAPDVCLPRLFGPTPPTEVPQHSTAQHDGSSAQQAGQAQGSAAGSGFQVRCRWGFCPRPVSTERVTKHGMSPGLGSCVGGCLQQAHDS